MTIRFYLIPMEEGPGFREVKYFRTRWGSGTIDAPMGVMDYGLMNVALVVSDVTAEQHDLLVSEIDVVSIPQNINENVSAIALPQVKAAIESLRIPADWITTNNTYRELLRMIASLFQFVQRYHGMHDEVLIDNQSQLDLRWNEIPQNRQQKIIATADFLGYDYSWVTNTMLVRTILKGLADAWGNKPFKIGGFEF